MRRMKRFSQNSLPGTKRPKMLQTGMLRRFGHPNFTADTDFCDGGDGARVPVAQLNIAVAQPSDPKTRTGSIPAAKRIVLTWLAPLAAMFLIAMILAGCAPTTIKRGHHFRTSDLSQIQEGMTKDQVVQVLGTPDTTSPVGTGLGYYYISSIEKQNSFMKPDEVERKVVAVYFNRLESVERIAHYGMKDGKVFDFIDRKTSTHTRDQNILKSLFRNLGKKQGIF